MHYYKELYVYQNRKPKKAIIRTYLESDFKGLIGIQKESFPPPFPSELWWNEEQLKSHIQLFPEGAICIEIDGVICASMTNLIVDLHNKNNHTWEDITSGGYITNHNEYGNSLYVVDICVSPKYRALGLGKLLLQAAYEIVVNKKLENLVAGCRIPGYSKVSHLYTPEQYMNRVASGEDYDAVMTFFMKSGSIPTEVACNYLEDEESQNCAVIMEWRNPFHATKEKSKRPLVELV